MAKANSTLGLYFVSEVYYQRKINVVSGEGVLLIFFKQILLF